MTLYQMSFLYREDALRLHMRITVLREQAHGGQRGTAAPDAAHSGARTAAASVA